MLGVTQLLFIIAKEHLDREPAITTDLEPEQQH